jgi:2-keto-4-pentenoate hydratase
MSTDRVLAAAALLADLRRSRRVVDDLPDALRPTTLTDAYRVQAALVEQILPPGAEAVGYKVACTSAIAQQALRIDRPLFGRLLAHRVHGDGARLAADDFTHRVVEAEFAFVIGRDVPRRPDGHTRHSVASCIAAVVPAVEIVDYRYASWTVGAHQVAADNAIHGCIVRGGELTDWTDLDLGACAVRVRRNGEVVTEGSGAAVLGHPLEVMRWLADELPRYGLDLRAGDVVTTGVTTDVFEAVAGDVIVAEFDGLGTATLSFR